MQYSADRSSQFRVDRATVALLLLFIAACAFATPGKAAQDPAEVRLKLRADGLPDNLVELQAAAVTLARRSDKNAFLYGIKVSPKSSSGNRPASVSHSFFFPVLSQKASVSFVHVVNTLSPEDIESARRAGVLELFRKSFDELGKPQLIIDREGSNSSRPVPLPPANLGFREAHTIAIRGGLRNFDGARLTASEKQSVARFSVWAFDGNFPGNREARNLYVSAIDGRIVAEGEVYDSTLADHYRKVDAELRRLGALLRRNGDRGSGGTSSCAEYCAYSAEMCRSGTAGSTDVPGQNAAVGACVDAETLCSRGCP